MGACERRVRAGLAALIGAYQKAVSPVLGPCCRFYPTCSEYAKEVVRNKPLPVALILAVKRILKCHPLHPGGYDPVKL